MRATMSSLASFKSSTTQRRSRIQHGYCIGVSRRSAQATAEGKGLAQGTYVAVRAEVEPTTLRLKVIVSTKAPPRPIYRPTYIHTYTSTGAKVPVAPVESAPMEATFGNIFQ